LIYDYQSEKRREARIPISYLMFLIGVVVIFTTVSAVEGCMMEVRGTYERAVKHRGRTVSEALEAVEVFLQQNPDDVVATMYQGSLYAMLAGDSFFPWKKIYYLRKGIDLMDDSMERLAYARSHGRDPELEMLLVRGITNARIPRIFNRGALARQDLNRIRKHSCFSDLPEKVRAEVLAWIAWYAQEDGKTERAEVAMAEARKLDTTMAEAVWSER